MSPPDSIVLATKLIATINDREPEQLLLLLDEGSEVVTGRSVRRGPEEIGEWAAKEYDHLVRCYAIDDWRTGPDSVLGFGAVQYVWSDGGEVADSSPIALELSFGADGRLGKLLVHDDAAAALGAFAAR